jgi:hypothetical protein
VEVEFVGDVDLPPFLPFGMLLLAGLKLGDVKRRVEGGCSIEGADVGVEVMLSVGLGVG